jgi:hypothetical protein
MLEISGLAPIFFVLYIGFFIFNFGTTMAYLSRYHPTWQWDFMTVLNVYTVSFLVGLFSFFAVPANFVVVEFPNHGWKLWHGEIRHPRNKWFDRRERDRERYELSLRHRMKMNTKADGLCNSIWE